MEGLRTLNFQNFYHEQQINLSTLKRRFKAVDLHGRGRLLLIPWTATIEEVNNAVQKELDASGLNLGYRRIWARLQTIGSCKEGRRSKNNP